MNINNITISLVVPCYNEETNIQKGVLDKIGNYTQKDKRFIEVLIVDDGSTDSTKKTILEKYLPQFKKIRLIKNPHLGKAFAVMKGIEESKGEFVVFSDFDLATPIEEVDKLIKQVTNDIHIVIGSRKSQRTGAPVARKILSIGAMLFRNYLIGLKGIHDTQCGFKLFERKAAVRIISKQLVFQKERKATGASVSAGFDMEFLFVANKLKYKIKEVPVAWKHVETRNVSFFKDAKEALMDIVTIKYNELMNKYDFSA
jgi:dolichyl-phosphate beta-glucosyltransferase